MRKINVNTISKIYIRDCREKECDSDDDDDGSDGGGNNEEFVCPSIGPLVFLFFCRHITNIKSFSGLWHLMTKETQGTISDVLQTSNINKLIHDIFLSFWPSDPK